MGSENTLCHKLTPSRYASALARFLAWCTAAFTPASSADLLETIQHYLLHCLAPPRPGTARSFLAALSFANSRLPNHPFPAHAGWPSPPWPTWPPNHTTLGSIYCSFRPPALCARRPHIRVHAALFHLFPMSQQSRSPPAAGPRPRTPHSPRC